MVASALSGQSMLLRFGRTPFSRPMFPATPRVRPLAR